MAKSSAKRAAGRPPSAESSGVTDAILQAAARAFVARGFASTTMRAIAQGAKVSPQTLYARFPDKTELYEALMRSRTEALLTAMTSLLEEDTVPTVALQGFGERLISTFLGSDLQRLHQRVIESAANFPRLADVFFEQGPNRGRKLLEGYLCKQVQRGALKISRVDVAAEQFIGSLVGGVVIRSTLAQRQIMQDPGEIQAWVQQAVGTFLRAHGLYSLDSGCA